MFIKPKSRSTRGYSIYALTGTILESIALLIILLIVLPLFDINLEWWLVAVIVVVELAISAFTYSMGRRALSKKLESGSDSMMGCVGIVTTPLNPTGYVKIRGELWKASCMNEMETGSEVVVIGIEGIKLTVVLNERTKFTAAKPGKRGINL
jgi:membrane protein implicated in regulation of membrane protease activity